MKWDPLTLAEEVREEGGWVRGEEGGRKDGKEGGRKKEGKRDLGCLCR